MRLWSAILPLSLLLLSGCGPEFSLNPLFEEKDVVFEQALVGTWITSEATSGQVNEGITYTFAALRDNAYEVIFPGDDEVSTYRSEVHLVRLGNFLFLDADPPKADPDEEKQNKAPKPFPQIGVHLIGRIWIEKDFVRIALLDGAWVRDIAEDRKLSVGFASVGGDTVLTGSTEELKKLALEYAGDTKAFSEEIDLCRPSFPASDCATAIFRQKLATNNPETWDSLGQEYSNVGQDEEALAAFRKAAQLDPSGGNEFHNYHYNIGRALLKRLQYEQAREEFLDAHRLRPTDSTPDGQIGFSYFAEAKFQDAVRAFQTDPWDVSCLAEGDCPARGRVGGQNNLTIFATLALRHLGRQEEARKKLDAYTGQEKAFAAYRKHAEWEALLLSYEAGKTTESELIGKAETTAQKTEAYFYVGYEYFLKGDKQNAREYFQKTVDMKVADSDEYITAKARLAQLAQK